MADVAGRRGVGSGSAFERRGDGDRGQIMLVTALSLAILFVALALILNTAIYTENLATRSSDIGGGTDAVRYQDATHDGVAGIIEYANYHNNSNQSTLTNALVAGVIDYRASSARQFALGDRAVDVSINTPYYGTRIVQTDESRNFTNATGTADWTVATDVENTRAFRMLVFRDVLAGALADGFVVVLDNSSKQWNMTVYQPSVNDIRVTVDGPTVSDSCTVTSSEAWINISEGTFGGEPCDALTTMGDGLSGSYDVRFENATDVRGSYTFVVDNGSIADDVANDLNPNFNEPGSGQPFATHAIYSARVEVIYETPRLYYESTVWVAPGEPE